ncbi:phage tail protein [Flavobacterium succinicans]|uniref:Phage tail collar domain protein n=1 Tax=Flavobacterium succinicans TaxID=29536 RepID=A0A199XM71_9FLAO|nr:tail fiber protein [Flavobacterium succinicans]OAZ02843.1 phage tail collar domain protein [Flavobacterium succinicans]
MEGVIGFTTLFAGNFAPKYWDFCNGQTINIASNTALFSILGTTYGGNGTTTFMLPNLKGRSVIGAGQGPGLSFYSLGQAGGLESVSLTPQQMPAHVHPVSYTIIQDSNTGASASTPTNNTYGSDSSGGTPYATPANIGLKPFAGNIAMANAGSGSVPLSIVDPYLGLNYIICEYGVYPSRN